MYNDPDCKQGFSIYAETETPVPEALHNRMRQLLLQYTVVGGMPDAVQTFADSKQMNEVLRIQRDIVRSYEDDMVKYAEGQEKSRIKECFISIPKGKMHVGGGQGLYREHQEHENDTQTP